MKVATFNINNINKRLPNLLAWLSEAKPDVFRKRSRDRLPIRGLHIAFTLAKSLVSPFIRFAGKGALTQHRQIHRPF